MKKIKIMGHYYELILKEDFRIDRNINMDGDVAKIDHVTRKIYADSSSVGFFEFILHECLHSLDDKLTLGLDESRINRLSEGLYCLLLDNDWLRPHIEEEMIEQTTEQTLKLNQNKNFTIIG